MKKLFENWRKHIKEIGPSPEFQKTLDRAQRGWQKSMDGAAEKAAAAGEPEDNPYDEELEAEDEKAKAIAKKYGLEASADYASDGKLAILVRTPDYDYAGFHSAVEFEEMMKTLAAEGLSGDEMHQQMVKRQEEEAREPRY